VHGWTASRNNFFGLGAVLDLKRPVRAFRIAIGKPNRALPLSNRIQVCGFESIVRLAMPGIFTGSNFISALAFIPQIPTNTNFKPTEIRAFIRLAGEEFDEDQS
jgi:hypothetical protein